MTDDAFNRYLAKQVRDMFPAVTDDDPHVELRDGVPTIIFGTGRIAGPGMSSLGGYSTRRATNIVTHGLHEATQELERRQFER